MPFKDVLFFLLSMAIILAMGPRYIGFLQRRYLGQYIREDGPKSHHQKAGTPTAGGLLMLLAITFCMALAAIKETGFATDSTPWLVLAGTLVLGGLGFIDDFLKITKKHNKGVSGYTKLAIQALVGLGIGWFALLNNPTGEVSVWGLSTVSLSLFYPIWVAFWVTGFSNAVNLTDGLDGLAAGTSLVTFLALAVILGAMGLAHLSLVAWIFTGALLGFLWFNRHPAKVFMGDSGSLALGGAMAILVVLSQLDLWLLLFGIIFVAETLSVMLQVLSFKTTGKRIFKMSPLHHHFELCGWHETRVTGTFVMIQLLASLLGLGWLLTQL